MNIQHWNYSRVHTSDLNAIWLWFETSNCDKSASVVAGSFTLQGSRDGSTAVRFIVFVAVICLQVRKILQPKTFKDGQSRRNLAKISNVVWTSKLQSSREWWCHDHKSLLNHVKIVLCEWGLWLKILLEQGKKLSFQHFCTRWLKITKVVPKLRSHSRYYLTVPSGGLRRDLDF